MNNKPSAAGDDAILLQIEDLRIEGNSNGIWKPITHGISLELRRGEILGLVGESGAGKSTLGLAAMGYLRPGCRLAGGSVRFAGTDLMAASEAEQNLIRGSRIAYVAQSAAASFNPARRLIDQTVETAVYRELMSREEASADAKDLYRRLRLPSPDTIGERFPHQVSGGQLQRVMTAMAVSCRPDIIVFDEPTTALDVSTQRDVLIAMREVVRQVNAAALYITHDLAVVAQMATRIMVLRHGKVVEEAPTREIMSNPRDPYTRSLWSIRTLIKEPRVSTDLILDASKISVSYGNVKAVKAVSVRVPRGSTVAVVGESGSGKSTLACAIGGLAPSATGQMIFNGKPLSLRNAERDKDLRRRIQVIYQHADTALNPKQRVRDVIARPLQFFFGLKGEPLRARVSELLNLVELGEGYLDRLPSELSGGQKQRLGIARALAASPDLIICDEITSALDKIVQEEILKMLLKLQKELGVSYLFITHDIVTVKAIADEVVVMNAGEVVEQGSRADVFSPPHPDYTESLLSAVPEMDPDWLDRYVAGHLTPVDNVTEPKARRASQQN